MRDGLNYEAELEYLKEMGWFEQSEGKVLTDQNTEQLKSLGQSKTDYSTKYDPTLLEVFQNPQRDHPYSIAIEAPEFTCLCPKTRQPDFGAIDINYSPDQLCIESKSLKLYLFSFRQTGAFHEAVTNVIARDLFILMKPRWIEVTGKFNPRGGISFWPKVRLQKEDE